MTKHGNTIQEKNGFQLVELVNMEADGRVTIVGYAILDSEGNEMSRFLSWEEAIAAFAELTDDSAPPPPGESRGPSFG
jgi:hypothetical protein